MKSFVRTLRLITVWVLISLLICGCFGAFLYLQRTALQEPLFSAEYQGNYLLLRAAEQEYVLSLALPEKIARTLQRYYIFIPARYRLVAQGVVRLVEGWG